MAKKQQPKKPDEDMKSAEVPQDMKPRDWDVDFNYDGNPVGKLVLRIDPTVSDNILAGCIVAPALMEKDGKITVVSWSLIRANLVRKDPAHPQKEDPNAGNKTG